MERLLLPVTDLRAADTYNLSTATLLREGRGLLFYHTKVALLNHVLNHTAHRGAEDSSPEVSLDPLEALEGVFERIKLRAPELSNQQIFALTILNLNSNVIIYYNIIKHYLLGLVFFPCCSFFLLK